MSEAWRAAVKQYKEENPEHTGVIRKGTPEYDAVNAIFKGEEQPPSKPRKRRNAVTLQKGNNEVKANIKPDVDKMTKKELLSLIKALSITM